MTEETKITSVGSLAETIKLSRLSPKSVRPLQYEVLDVAPEKLLVDHAYQRDISKASIRLIRKLIREWSWSAFTPPKVTVYPGTKSYYVLDGQHTAIAATLNPDITSIPVFRVDKELGKEDRAEAFVRHNKDRNPIRSVDLYKARLEAGDETATSLFMAQRRTNVRFVADINEREEGTIPCVCVTTCLKIVSNKGPQHMRLVFDVVSEAKLSVLNAFYVKAISVLVSSSQFPTDVLALAIRSYPESRLTEDVMSRASRLDVAKATAAAQILQLRCEALVYDRVKDMVQ